MINLENDVDYYFTNSKIIDLRLCDIVIDYYSGKIRVELLDEGDIHRKRDNIKLCFDNFISFKIDNLKPFGGGGMYVCDNYLENINSIKKYIIQLNSGDFCEIVCKNE